MKKQYKGYDHFGDIHPLFTFFYFMSVFFFTVMSFDPVCLLAALAGAALYCLSVLGFGALLKRLFAMLPVFLAAALINPLFSHKGQTILTYFPNGNPLTAESVLFGLASGAMLVAVLMWAERFNAVMTSDKIIYIFGKILPNGSLLISMTFRFIPYFTECFKEILQIRKTAAQKRPFSGIRSVAEAFSVLMSRMLESSIEISDSMQARGYGSCKRTNYSLFRITFRDKTVFVIWGILFAVLVAFFMHGRFSFDYYPAIKTPTGHFAAYPSFFALYLIPVVINIKEEMKWRLLRSKI